MPLDVRFVDAAGNPLGRNGGDPVEVSVQNQAAQATSIGQSVNLEIVADVTPTQFALGPGNEQTRLVADPVGTTFAHPHPPQVWSYTAEFTGTTTDQTVHAAPGTDYSLYITDIYLHLDTAIDVNLEQDETPDVPVFKFYGQAAGDGVAQSFRCPIKLAANKALYLNTGNGTGFIIVTGFISYVGA